MRAKRSQQRSGASASPRASFVMVLCTPFMIPLFAFTSFVRNHPFPPKNPTTTKNGVVRDFASVLVDANTRRTRRRTIRRRPGVSAAEQRHQAPPARDADASASTAFLGFRARGPGAFPKVSPTITYHTSISQRARSVLRCTCGRLSAKSADVVPRTVQEPLSATATQARRLDRRFPPGAWPRDGAVLWADIPTRRAARLGLDRARNVGASRRA